VGGGGGGGGGGGRGGEGVLKGNTGITDMLRIFVDRVLVFPLNSFHLAFPPAGHNFRLYLSAIPPVFT
jgi:hypothetical protein